MVEVIGILKNGRTVTTQVDSVEDAFRTIYNWWGGSVSEDLNFSFIYSYDELIVKMEFPK